MTEKPQLTPSGSAIPDLVKGFMRGALPPDGMEAFVHQLRTTTTNVCDLYANMIRHQWQGVERLFSGMFEQVSSPPPEQSVPTVSAERLSEEPAQLPASTTTQEEYTTED